MYAAADWLRSVALVSQARLSRCWVAGSSTRQETTSISSAIGRAVVSCTFIIRRLGHFSLDGYYSSYISFSGVMRAPKKLGSWTREATHPTECSIWGYALWCFREGDLFGCSAVRSIRWVYDVHVCKSVVSTHYFMHGTRSKSTVTKNDDNGKRSGSPKSLWTGDEVPICNK